MLCAKVDFWRGLNSIFASWKVRSYSGRESHKSRRTGFFLHVELLHSCFLHAPVGDPFYERCNPFNNMDPLSETDVIQTESPENVVVIFEILPIDKEWKSNEITSCRSWASCGFNDRNATLQVDFFPTSTTLELELFNCVLFHRTKFEFSFFFTVTVL